MLYVFRFKYNHAASFTGDWWKDHSAAKRAGCCLPRRSMMRERSHWPPIDFHADSFSVRSYYDMWCGWGWGSKLQWLPGPGDCFLLLDAASSVRPCSSFSRMKERGRPPSYWTYLTAYARGSSQLCVVGVLPINLKLATIILLHQTTNNIVVSISPSLSKSNIAVPKILPECPGRSGTPLGSSHGRIEGRVLYVWMCAPGWPNVLPPHLKKGTIVERAGLCSSSSISSSGG